MAGNSDYYVEITTRLRAVQSFCDFLSEGGSVRIASTEAAPFIDVTSDLLFRNRAEAERLITLRRQLFPDRANEDVTPPLYNHH
ncbi:hypothetical protein B5K06_30050 [Rhizobium grahamii]|uniref:Uncharacterized protein n=1 Tax=Rhizobium grahamii TaxID=1120045 RepID=A0A370KFS2_9HYPH|nr:hypothetical protein B5K06_30050 [Rhizobium grahamii]